MILNFAISSFLLPLATTLGCDFWNDVDTLHNELTASQDLPTQSTINETQLVEPTPPVTLHSHSRNETDENHIKHRRKSSKKYFQKNVTLTADKVNTFTQKTIIDKSYPKNTSLSIIENKLLALGSLQEWFDLNTYDIHKYSIYWAKVCVWFWGQPVDGRHRYLCTISASYGSNKKRVLTIRRKKHYLDLLYCKCHNYESNYRFPVSAPERFLIHKSGDDEFYIFEPNSKNLAIKGLKGGIILPKPHEENENSTSASTFIRTFVTVGAYDIDSFNQSITIDQSYPENISLAELEEKLMEFEEIKEWPDLHNYDLDKYSMYWGNLCVFLWGKPLDRAHRQACLISTSYGTHRLRKLFVAGKTKHFDLLCCKCHSYISNCKNPISNVDTFLIHRGNENEFFVFEQRATEYSAYTLFIKSFKRTINQPDPAAFK